MGARCFPTPPQEPIHASVMAVKAFPTTTFTYSSKEARCSLVVFGISSGFSRRWRAVCSRAHRVFSTPTKTNWSCCNVSKEINMRLNGERQDQHVTPNYDRTGGERGRLVERTGDSRGNVETG